MTQLNKREQQQLGYSLKEMSTLDYRLDPIIEDASRAQEQVEKVLRYNQQVLLLSQIFVSRSAAF